MNDRLRAILENQILEALPNGFSGVGIGDDGEIYRFHLCNNSMQWFALRDGLKEFIADTFVFAETTTESTEEWHDSSDDGEEDD